MKNRVCFPCLAFLVLASLLPRDGTCAEQIRPPASTASGTSGAGDEPSAGLLIGGVGGVYFLAYQRKRPGQPWEPPRVLIVAPFSEYSVFYHRLTIDRKGRLFLSYDYWSTFWFYRNDHFGRRRALLMSPDGGDTWKLAQTEDLIL